jgi:hypothetical protein
MSGDAARLLLIRKTSRSRGRRGKEEGGKESKLFIVPTSSVKMKKIYKELILKTLKRLQIRQLECLRSGECRGTKRQTAMEKSVLLTYWGVLYRHRSITGCHGSSWRPVEKMEYPPSTILNVLAGLYHECHNE